MQGITDEGITNGTYAPTVDTILNDLRKFQDFLRRNFKANLTVTEMRPVSNQPGRLYATAKTHKFSLLDEITIEKLKFRPAISQVGTYTYNAAKVIADYLKPLCQNEYKINDMQSFPSMLKDQTPLNPNEEYVSDDEEFLFTNILVDETINYIINEIYQEKKLPQICSMVNLSIVNQGKILYYQDSCHPMFFKTFQEVDFVWKSFNYSVDY